MPFPTVFQNQFSPLLAQVPALTLEMLQKRLRERHHGCCSLLGSYNLDLNTSFLLFFLLILFFSPVPLEINWLQGEKSPESQSIYRHSWARQANVMLMVRKLQHIFMTTERVSESEELPTTRNYQNISVIFEFEFEFLARGRLTLVSYLWTQT